MEREEQIKELHSFLDEMWIDYPPSASEVVEALCDEGYHKTIWYKVADGDLPTINGDYIVITASGYKGFAEYNEFTGPDGINKFCWVNRFYEFKFIDDVLAWTEFPIYEE